MVRFFLILMALAAMVWIGQRYFVNNPNGASFWDSMGGHMDAPSTPAAAGASPSPTPMEHTIQGCRTALTELSQKELLPLESSKDFSDADARQVLQTVQRDLAEYRFDHDYKNLVQACALLGQALQERQALLAPLAEGRCEVEVAGDVIANGGPATGDKRGASRGWRANNGRFFQGGDAQGVEPAQRSLQGEGGAVADAFWRCKLSLKRGNPPAAFRRFREE